MKLKILKNVVVGRKVEKAGTIVDVDRKTASTLLDRKCAEEYTESPPQQQQQQPGDGDKK
jgi:hypothetical protein